VGASLLIRSAINVSQVDLGFRAEHAATWAFEVSRSKHATDQALADYYGRMLDAVRTVPGVAHAAITNRVPLAGNQTNSVHFANATGIKEELSDVDSRTVSPDYFTTIGVRLLAGRAFTDHDDAASPSVVVVDDRVVRTVWPGEQVLGKRLRGPDGRWATVVGVVNHIRASGLEVDPRPQVYWSYRQWTQNRGALVVRTVLDPRSLFTPVIRAVHTVDPEQALYDVSTMRDVVDRSQAQRRLTTTLMIGFAALALLLAAVGLYGVVAYGVTGRMREFGIRVALGATKAEVTRLVVRQGMSMAVIGSIIGVALALGASDVMSKLVYEVPPRDALSVLGSTFVLLLVVVAASWLPARKAAAVDPGLTLRAE
jgi:putative ABC transport system permease protein